MAQDLSHKNDGNADFQWAFYLNRRYLDPIGVWPSNKTKSALKSLWLPLSLIIVVSGYCLPTACAIIQVRHVLPLVIDNSLTAIASWVAACKVFCLWYYRPVYHSLIKWTNADWCRRVETWERDLMFKQARRGRLLTTIGSITMFVHANGILAAPLLHLSIRIINNITDPNPQHILPISSCYPYECHMSPYYEITYIGQALALLCASAAYSGLDNFFSALVFHASGQCEILTERMRRLCDHASMDHQLFTHKVRELIDFHNYLVGFVKAIEQSFSAVILIHILGSIILICSVSYGFIKAFHGSPPAIQTTVFIAAIINLNEHIFIYCFTAEILATNSSEIFEGIYDCRWYNLPAKEARYLILIMTRSQHSLQLSAGKFVYLSLNTYIRVLKSTAGYISMLLTVG